MGIFKVQGLGKLTPDQRSEVARLYSSGQSVASLSKNYKITPKNVKGLLSTRGVKLREYVPIPRKRRKHRLSAVPVHERWATKQVELAIRRGDLKRSGACSACFKPGKVHGHHDDYGKPLIVRWLCRPCHADWHSLNIPIPSNRNK